MSEATVKFARAAERARVKRFVFLSSIRAQSGPTAEGVLTEEREPRPTDAYGRSKLAAEQGLAETALDWVALRLALVYGPGVEGNMARLIKLARSPYPLPLAGLILCVSGRLSFELVQKAAVAGCPILVGVGAPSSLAVELAADRGMTLAGFARGASVNVYAGAARLAKPRPEGSVRGG